MINDRWYNEGATPETEWERFAQAFVQKLIDGDPTAAYEMLSSELKAELSLQTFQQNFNDIVSVDDVPIGPAWVIMSICGYPEMRPDELGSVYVQVGGDNNEAMSVFVQSDGKAGFSVLRIEWGRP